MSAPRPVLRWTATILTVLLVAFLVFDGVTKVLEIAPVVKASRQLGLPEAATAAIGWLLLGCTALYVWPRTKGLGAVLLTGFLGGTIAVHIVARNGVFPVVFSLGVGLLVWAPLAIRWPGLVRLLLGGAAPARENQS